jgi:hypothetical protein
MADAMTEVLIEVVKRLDCKESVDRLAKAIEDLAEATRNQPHYVPMPYPVAPAPVHPWSPYRPWCEPWRPTITYYTSGTNPVANTGTVH